MNDPATSEPTGKTTSGHGDNNMLSQPFLKRCPKSGRIVGLGRQVPFRTLLWPLVGLAALGWLCLRTFSKPSRFSYPCQQAAAPVAAGFLFWIAGLFASMNLFNASKKIWRRHKLASAMTLVGSVAVLVSLGSTSATQPFAQNAGNTGVFIAKDPQNSPMGIARGIHPGRVSWIHDPTSVLYNGTGSYPEDKNFDQTKLDNMLRRLVISIPGGTDLRGSWDSLFAFNNRSRGRSNKGYAAGEKIAIKVNLNSEGSTTAVDQTPQLVRSLLRQLVDTMKVAQTDILVYDAIRPNGAGTIKRICGSEFPNVRYNDFSHPNGTWADVLKFTNPGIPADSRNIPRWVAEAPYMINFAILKRHSLPSSEWSDWVGQASITVTGKNHCGSLKNCAALHPFFRDYLTGDKTYNAVVDLMSSPMFNDKTVLFLVDGLLTANHHSGGPLRWKMTPFNNAYPASVFASQDQVAMESVALDFLQAEMQLPAFADNTLHEAALISNPPSKINYANKGTNISMGVHEHWNNPIDKKYSRNLKTGNGIELVQVPISGGVSAGIATAKRSGPGIAISIRQDGGAIVKSSSPLRCAEHFDVRGRILSRIELSGTSAVLEPSDRFRASFLRVQSENGTTTQGL